MLGVTFEKKKGNRETCWWNKEFQESIKEKKEAKKTWEKIIDEKNKDVQRKEE